MKYYILNKTVILNSRRSRGRLGQNPPQLADFVPDPIRGFSPYSRSAFAATGAPPSFEFHKKMKLKTEELKALENIGMEKPWAFLLKTAKTEKIFKPKENQYNLNMPTNHQEASWDARVQVELPRPGRPGPRRPSADPQRRPLPWPHVPRGRPSRTS